MQNVCYITDMYIRRYVHEILCVVVFQNSCVQHLLVHGKINAYHFVQKCFPTACFRLSCIYHHRVDMTNSNRSYDYAFYLK